MLHDGDSGPIRNWYIMSHNRYIVWIYQSIYRQSWAMKDNDSLHTVLFVSEAMESHT